jgi:hypothetical protein
MLRPIAIAIALAVCSLSGSSSAYAQSRHWGQIATNKFSYENRNVNATGLFESPLPFDYNRSFPGQKSHYFGGWLEPGPAISGKVTVW